MPKENRKYWQMRRDQGRPIRRCEGCGADLDRDQNHDQGCPNGAPRREPTPHRTAADLLNKTTVYVLCNTFGPIAVYDDEDRAYEMLSKVEDNEDQQNNSIEEFVLNEHPDISELLA